MKEILLVVSVFEKGTKEGDSKHCKRVIGITDDMLKNNIEGVQAFAHNTVNIALNEYAKNISKGDN